MDVALDERTRFVIGEQIRSKIDPLLEDFFHFCLRMGMAMVSSWRHTPKKLILLAG
jgi:hypothetical protein